MKKIIELEKVFNQAVADLKESFEGLKAELISVDKPELIMHDGKQLKRVEREAEEGDYVRFVEDFGGGTESGKFYEVIEEKHYLDDIGVVLHVYGWGGGAKAVEGVYEIVYETVNRVAGIGERILVVNKSAIGEVDYKNGDVATVRSSLSTGVITEEFGEGLFHSEYEVIVEPGHDSIVKELTANQQRAELVERAKEFVEKYREDIGAYRDVGNDTARRNFYETEFFVKGNKVTAVVYRLDDYGNRFSGKPSHVGRALCMPGEVFNNWVGKAIALARALGIDVPEEFLNAVQPDEVVVGMEVSANDSVNEYTVGRFYKEEKRNGELGEAFLPVGHRMGAWLGVKQVKIINDTNAIYEEVDN